MARVLCLLLLLASWGCRPEVLEEIVSPEGKFRAKMPVGYKVQQNQGMDAAGREFTLFEFVYLARNHAYTISYSNTEPSQHQTEKRKFERLNSAQNAVLAQKQTRLVQSKILRLDEEFPGVEWVVQNDNLFRRSRLYLVDDRLYQLAVVGDETFIRDALADEFLDSFALLQTPDSFEGP